MLECDPLPDEPHNPSKRKADALCYDAQLPIPNASSAAKPAAEAFTPGTGSAQEEAGPTQPVVNASSINAFALAQPAEATATPGQSDEQLVGTGQFPSHIE